MTARREQLQELLAARRRELNDLRAALPAHSVRPHQLIEIEELEEEIERLEAELQALEAECE
ncbi:MAG: hypothetical protein Kow00129_13260 [Thermoleophilia bacterium]